MLFLCQDNQLNINHGLSVLYFYAPWVPLHRKMVEMLSEMESSHPDAHFYAIDIVQFPSYIKRFELLSLPTLLFRKEEGKRAGKNLVGLPAVFNAKPIFDDIYQRHSQRNKGKPND